MRIVHAAGEMFPYIKTGGLADVVGALSAALAGRGHEVTVVIPGYRAVLESPPVQDAKRTQTLKVRMGSRDLAGEVHTLAVRPGLTLQLVVREEFFDRRQLYWTGEREYDDNDARFIFFQKGVIEIMRAAGGGFDILHAHDWQTGLLPLLLRNAEQRGGVKLAARTVFTVHNMIYQGVFPRSSFALTNLHESLNAMDGIEYFGQISLLKGGLMYADRLTTVSPTYAQEIQTPEHGCGLEGVVRLRSGTVRGIRNGIETSVWNPATDLLLPARFSANNLAGKATCRAALFTRMGWKESFDGPVFAIVSRMTTAKGHDLLLGAIDYLLKKNCRLIVLGSGEAKYEQAHLAAAAAHPGRIAVFIGVNEELSHLAFAGADFFLMPSHTEPCGLTQMYAQVYGTVPLASRVGGLIDTVRDIAEAGGNGTGLMFRPEQNDFVKALGTALKLFSNPLRYAAVQQNAMRQDFSWQSVVGQYEQLYQE